MLMPVSAFSTSRLAYKQKKTFPFCMPKFYLSQAKILNKRKESRRRLQLEFNWRILYTKRILKNANTYHVHRLGKKMIFFHVTCTLRGNADAAVGSLLSSCHCLCSTLFWGGGGIREDASCPGTILLSCYSILSVSVGRLYFQSFSTFCSTKMQSFSLFFLMNAEAKKFCFPALSSSSVNNFPLAWAVPHRPFVWNARIKTLLCLCEQPSTLVCHIFCCLSDTSDFADFFHHFPISLALWCFIDSAGLHSLFCPHLSHNLMFR